MTDAEQADFEAIARKAIVEAVVAVQNPKLVLMICHTGPGQEFPKRCEDAALLAEVSGNTDLAEALRTLGGHRRGKVDSIATMAVLMQQQSAEVAS